MSDPVSSNSSQKVTPAEKAAQIAEFVLADLPDDVALVARRCVILHWFDQPVVAALAPDASAEQAASIFEELTALPFIEPVPGGFAYHALTREGLLKQYADEQTDLLVTACKLALPAYAARTNDNQAIAEAFFCTIIAGETESAAKVLGDAYKTLSARSDWAAISYWFSLQDEAEALHFVKPLTRDFLQWAMRSIVHSFSKDWSAAIADLNHAIELNSNNSIAYYLRGNAYNQQKNYDAALADFTRAIELDPNNATVYNNRGNAYNQQKNYDAALADYTRAIELDPNNATVYDNRGGTYFKQKNYEAALADHTRAIELDPNNATVYNNRGGTYHKQENYEAALADCAHAIELDPNYVAAYNNRGGTYHKQKNYEAALADFTRALELDPNYAAAYSNRGGTYCEQKNFEAALADLNRALELDPNDAAAYTNRGSTYAYLRDYSLAIADFDCAMRLDSSDAAPMYGIACTHALQGNVKQACTWLRKAITMSNRWVGQAQTDSDFDAIRDTPEFQALMQEFAPKA